MLRRDATTVPNPASTTKSLPLALLIATAFLSAIAPVAVDLYLPSFPQLAEDFGTDQTGAQLTLTTFLIGIAIGQLVLGPISDRYGRRLPLIIGAAVCCIASAAAVLAPSLPILILARFLQGASGAAGMVIGRAIIADVASGRTAARAFGLMMTIGGIAPIVGPVIGGVLAAPLGWRGVLVIVLALAVIMIVVVVTVVPETHPAERRALLRRSSDGGSALRALRSRTFIGYALICGFSFAALLAYVSASPFLYQDVIGMSPALFGMAFGVNALVLVAATFVSSRLTSIMPPRLILRLGLLIMTAAITAFSLVTAAGWPPALFAICIPGMLAGFGLVQGNAVAEAITSVPRAAGSASAIIGFSQFALSGVTSALVGIDQAHPAGSLSIVVFGCLAVMLAGLLISRQPRGTNRVTGPTHA